MTWWNLLVGVVVVIGVILLWIRERLRATAFRRLARRLGFQYMGKAKLPEALSLYGTPFNHAWFIENQIDGNRGATRVIAFDCQIGKEYSQVQRTVIAVHAPLDAISKLLAGSRFTVSSSAAWTLVYEPFDDPSRNTALMSVAELAACIEVISG